MGSLAAKEAAAWPWPAVNPEIYNSGNQFTGGYYDPFTGRVVIRTDRTRVRESYLDPARGQVDIGSLHYVNEIQVDASGVQWRVQGWKWTSFGVPHGDLKRTRVQATGIPGVDHEENDRVLYSLHTGGNNTPGQSVSGGGQSTQRNYGQRRNFRSGGYNPF